MIHTRMLDRPQVFMTGNNGKDIHKQLGKGHLQRPIINIALTNPEQCAALNEYCLQLIHGIAIDGEPGRTVRGRLLVTDLGGVIQEGGTAQWLRHLLCLTDHSPAPLPDAEGAGPDTTPAMDCADAYQEAAELAWARRITVGGAPLEEPLEFMPVQQEWIRFLQGLEPTCPGIIHAARTLPLTILFGLLQMVKAAKHQPLGKFQVASQDGQLLARLLVTRMCNLRATLSHSAAEARRLRQHVRLLEILRAGPLPVRAIVRKIHRISTSDCRELLEERRESGRVIDTPGDRWELANPAATIPAPKPLTLEV